MSDAALIADLVRAGLDAELVGRVANAMLNVRDNVRDNAVREYERNRKRDQREALAAQANAGGAQANDGAASDGEIVPQNVPDATQNHCDLTSLLPSLKVLTEKRSKEERMRARGTRLAPGTPLSEIDRAAAIKLGASADRLDAMWAEFVDFWIGVPGQRGTKLDWPATWRNRVRDVISRGNRNGRHNGQSDRSTSAAGNRVLEKLRSLNAPIAADRS